VSALMFDYILTGPISGVSAGQYIVGLVASTATYFGHPWSPSADIVNLYAAGIAALVTVYFWWRNTKGIHESSDDALKIMYVTTVMVVLLVAWSGVTILRRPEAQRLPPTPVVGHLVFTDDAVGWMPRLVPHSLRPVAAEGSPALSEAASSASNEPQHFAFVPNAGMLLGLIGILMAFGHSFLAMSGEESLAQVNRELEYPKHKNLMKAGMVIFIYSLLFTSLVSFFAYALIPDDVRPQYFNNLISGIALFQWMTVGRLIRAEFLSLRERDFVAAARTLGVPARRIMFIHLLPNAMAPLPVALALVVANAILIESALSFLGCGIPPPTPTWGNMLTNAQSYVRIAPWLAVFPGLLITLCVGSVVFVGDALRDAFDPRLAE